jgi:hypothetical protein
MTPDHCISGRVTKVGYYRDTLPKLVVTIPKNDAGGLSIDVGERVDLQLYLHGETYHAGIRTTPNARTLTICPDLLNVSGSEIRLTDLLLQHNIQQKATVTLSISAEGIAIIT